jgi:hypothetical protein
MHLYERQRLRFFAAIVHVRARQIRVAAFHHRRMTSPAKISCRCCVTIALTFIGTNYLAIVDIDRRPEQSRVSALLMLQVRRIVQYGTSIPSLDNSRRAQG